ncbi:MAG: YCF48-related protein [Mucilaginibacter sp.]
MTFRITNLPFLLILLFILPGCKKNQPAKTPAPTVFVKDKSIEVVSGNNQFGYAGHPLDTIVIKVTLNSAEDSSKYSYFTRTGDTQGTLYVVGSYYSNGANYLKALWSPGPGASSATATFYSFSNCTLQELNQQGGCKTLDSVKITATIRKPWLSVYSGSTGGIDVLYDILFTDTNNGITMGEGTGIVRTTDGGKTWTMGPPARSDDDVQLMAFATPDTGLICTVNNYAEITTDGGKTYDQPSWTPPFVGHHSSLAYYMLSRNIIYTVGVRGQIAKTTDGGNTWTQAGFNILNNFHGLTATDNNTLYACGDIGKIVKSTDAGKTWRVQPLQLNNNLNTIYFIDNSFGFAGGQYGALVRTTNGGTDWSIIKTGLQFPVIAIRFFTSLHGFIVSGGGEIAESNDGGLTWALRNTSNYGVGNLNKAVIKDETIIFGVQQSSIYTYDLTQR